MKPRDKHSIAASRVGLRPPPRAADGKKTIYMRKLSTKEVHEKFIQVLKSDLRKFPATNVPFTLRYGEQNYRLKVEKISTEAAGPTKEHYRIAAGKLFVTNGFERGDRLVLTKTAEKVYSLRIL